MNALWRHELRLNRRMLLALLAALGIFGFAMALIAPSIQESMQAAMKAIPPFLRAMVGESLKAKGLGGVMAIVFSHPFWLILSGAWAVGYGARAIAADVERGTMGLMLAYPVTRTQLFAAKALVLGMGVVALAVLPVFTAFLGLSVQGESLAAGFGGYFWAAVGMMLLFGCIGGFSFFCSALSSEAGKALSFALAFTLGSYFLDVLGQFWKTAEPYRAGSIFRHYEPKLLLEGHPPELAAWLILGGGMVLSLFAAWVAFNRRDLSI